MTTNEKGASLENVLAGQEAPNLIDFKAFSSVVQAEIPLVAARILPAAGVCFREGRR